MKIKGWELMKKIADGEIKLNQKIKIIFNDGSKDNFIFDGADLIRERTFESIFRMYITTVVLAAEFELEDEIDIDSIEDYKQQHKERCIDIDIRNKINELIKAVKQLNNRLEEK